MADSVLVFVRAPTRVTAQQLIALRRELWQLDRTSPVRLAHWLHREPISVITRMPPALADLLIRRTAEAGLALECMPGLGPDPYREALGCPEDAEALLELLCEPSFDPPLFIRVSASPDSGRVTLHLRYTDVPLTLFLRPLTDIQGLGEHEHPHSLAVRREEYELAPELSGPLLEQIDRLRREPVVAPDPLLGLDGIRVYLTTHDFGGQPIRLDRWTPRPEQQPRLHGLLMTLLHTCEHVGGPEIAAHLPRVRRYLE